jgi:hypothetical protein
MSAFGSGDFPRFELPRHNPCAQCGRPIAAPEWIEESRTSAAFLWHCWACGYKFESVAVFRIEEVVSTSLAA